MVQLRRGPRSTSRWLSHFTAEDHYMLAKLVHLDALYGASRHARLSIFTTQMANPGQGTQRTTK